MVRFAPPRMATRIPIDQIKDGDWARSAGYWWRVRNVWCDPDRGFVGDLFSPRGTLLDKPLVWTIEAKRDAAAPAEEGG